MTSATTQAVLDEFPGARVTGSMPVAREARAVEPMPEFPVREAVLEGLRQSYAMIASQRSLLDGPSAAAAYLATSLEKIVQAAKHVKTDVRR